MPENLQISDTYSLHRGAKIPRLGFGCYLIPDGKETLQAVNTALEAGYRHFDTAAFYGNEASLGKAVRESGIPREKIFVTTKLWNSDHGYEKALRAFDTSMEKLQLDYLDLYLIHWPVPGKRRDSWKALEKLQAEGRVRSIGVSNYMEPHLRELMAHAESAPSINQIELSPYNFLRRQREIEFCRKNKIHIQAYCPLTRGEKLGDPELEKLGRKYGKSPAQILLRWSLDQGFIPLPKSGNPQRIRENANLYDFQILPEDLAWLSNQNENLAVSWDPSGAP
ncbi:MAG: aldo/keto reductase [Bacteroidia bacterium]|nr:aldo/keto reductase [Bacteroidia bacterium]